MRRENIVSIARSMLGTPFKTSMALKGVGCDCAGLPEVVLMALGQDVPPRSYSLVTALNFALQATENPKAGDVALLKSTANEADFHCGILTDKNTIIHAHWSQGVVENTYGNWFKKRAVSFYFFRGVE